jgi:hypothetical protein
VPNSKSFDMLSKSYRRKSWKTKKSFAKIAVENLFGQLGNKNSTNKKVLKTNQQDAHLAVNQENNKEDFNLS